MGRCAPLRFPPMTRTGRIAADPAVGGDHGHLARPGEAHPPRARAPRAPRVGRLQRRAARSRGTRVRGSRGPGLGPPAAPTGGVAAPLRLGFARESRHQGAARGPMRGGHLRQCTVLGATAAALLVAGCGSENDYANNPRPPSPITITASINDGRVEVSPERFGAGPVTL